MHLCHMYVYDIPCLGVGAMAQGMQLLSPSALIQPYRSHLDLYVFHFVLTCCLVLLMYQKLPKQV